MHVKHPTWPRWAGLTLDRFLPHLREIRSPHRTRHARRRRRCGRSSSRSGTRSGRSCGSPATTPSRAGSGSSAASVGLTCERVFPTRQAGRPPAGTDGAGPGRAQTGLRPPRTTGDLRLRTRQARHASSLRRGELGRVSLGAVFVEPSHLPLTAPEVLGIERVGLPIAEWTPDPHRPRVRC